MDLKNMNEKGFTYIIIVLIIMLFTTSLFLIARNINYSESKTDRIVNNYVNEINFLIKDNFDENTLASFNNSFKDYIIANNYHSKSCSIIYDGNFVYLTNFQDNNYSTINNEETLKFNLEDISENFSFGNCVFDINNTENKIYLEVSNDRERKIFNTFEINYN
jgi:hypothetical protein